MKTAIAENATSLAVSGLITLSCWSKTSMQPFKSELKKLSQPAYLFHVSVSENGIFKREFSNASPFINSVQISIIKMVIGEGNVQ